MRKNKSLYLLTLIIILAGCFMLGSPRSILGMGFRTEDPGPFLNWPLPANIGITNITRLPNSPWTHYFLGITDCPAYPALIDPGYWPYNTPGNYPGNRAYILPGVPDSRVKWQNYDNGWPFDNAFACYGQTDPAGGHAGTDISAGNGTSVLATAWADQIYVVYAVVQGVGEYRVRLRHPNVNGSGQTWYTYYVHMSSSAYPLGVTNPPGGVSVGTVLGGVGRGHLHFEASVGPNYAYTEARNIWGVDTEPWKGCLWLDTSLCPISPFTPAPVRHPRIMADVNGDNKADIVGFGDDAVYVSLSTGTVFSPAQVWTSNYTYNVGNWRVYRHVRDVADVNGDGKADIVGFGDDAVYVSLSTGASFGSVQTWTTNFTYNVGSWRVERHPRILADVNGDGKADIVGFGEDAVYVSLSTGTSFAPLEIWTNNFTYIVGEWRVEKHPRIVADVNGDSKADIIGFGEDAVYVSLSTGTSFAPFEIWTLYYTYNVGNWRVERHPRSVVDVNADGKADIVGFADNEVFVSLSTGISFLPYKIYIPFSVTPNDPTQIVSLSNTEEASWFTGGGFDPPQVWLGPSSSPTNTFSYNVGGWRVERHIRSVADLNGDNKADIVGFGDDAVAIALSTGTQFENPLIWLTGIFTYNSTWR